MVEKIQKHLECPSSLLEGHTFHAHVTPSSRQTYDSYMLARLHRRIVDSVGNCTAIYLPEGVRGETPVCTGRAKGRRATEMYM